MLQVVVNNPNTKKIETLTEHQFNSYMAQTNGEAANWIVSEFEKAFDPSEPRDDHGKWTADGGESGGTGYVKGKDLIGLDFHNPLVNAPVISFDLFGPSRPDTYLEAIAAKQGFDGPARMVDQTEFDQIARQSGYTRFRGVGAYTNAQGEKISGDAIITDFATGKYYGGTGVSGNGIYTTAKVDTASAYASKEGDNGALISMAILPDAQIASADRVNLAINQMQDPANPGGLDVGRILAAQGFDGYVTVGNGVPATIILNRTVLAVLKP